jgi:hypothetical protein
MRKLILSLVAAPLMLGSFATLSADEAKSTGINIFDSVKFSGEVRPRYEYANQYKNGAESGNSFTTRTTLGVKAGLFNVDGFSTFLEATSVNNLGYTNYSDGLIPDPNNPGKKIGNDNYDLIVDPQQARMTQAYLDYKVDDTLLRVGRQMVNLDDQRFVGAVGWRQMFQTFDAVSVVNGSVDNLTLLASYVYGRNEDTEQTEAGDTGSMLLNAKYKVSKQLNVTAYGYLLADIHDTYGLRLNGKVPVSKTIAINYDASYATQQDASFDYDGVTNAKIDATYYNVAVGANISGMIVGANYEVLGEANGASTKGFTTPLATLHKFQGFADVFLGRTGGSNNTGIVDANVKAGYKAKGFGKLIAWYHKFDDQGSADLGSEIDAVYANKVPGVKGLNGLLKFAAYSKGDATSPQNTTRFWAQLDYKF